MLHYRKHPFNCTVVYITLFNTLCHLNSSFCSSQITCNPDIVHVVQVRAGVGPVTVRICQNIAPRLQKCSYPFRRDTVFNDVRTKKYLVCDLLSSQSSANHRPSDHSHMVRGLTTPSDVVISVDFTWQRNVVSHMKINVGQAPAWCWASACNSGPDLSANWDLDL